MNGGRRVLAAGMGLLMTVSSLALGACDGTPTPLEQDLEAPTPVSTPDCGAAGEAPDEAPFGVFPMDEPPGVAEACLQPEADWEQLVGDGLAGWGYGVGTFLGDGAVVILPDDEGEISMLTSTEIQLPGARGGDLSLVLGTIAIVWFKTVGNIQNIVAGGVSIDPDYVVMEVTADPEKETTYIDVYDGEVTVTVLSTGVDYNILTGQRGIFTLEVEPVFEVLSGPNPAEIDRLLEIGEEYQQPEPEGLQFYLSPTFGEIDLSAGFMPDPVARDITSGGSVDVRMMGYGGSCTGFAATAPDFRVNWSGDANSVYVYFLAAEGGKDTTLIINDPAGNWICNDDYSGLEPLIRLDDPLPGQYDIWVGSYSSAEYIAGTLYVTEIAPDY